MFYLRSIMNCGRVQCLSVRQGRLQVGLCQQLMQRPPFEASLSTSTPHRNDKVYEVRTYNVKPEGMKTFMGLCQEHFHHRMSYSKMVGFWTSEIGGINDVVHIWEYDSLGHRAQVRASLGSDVKYFTDFYSKILPTLLRMDNSLVKCLPGTDIVDPPAPGVYELQQFCFPGKEPKDVVAHVQSMEKPGSKLLASCFNIIGPLSGEMGTLLWHHPDIDNVLKSSTSQTKEVKIVHSRLLLSAPWSPMQ